MRRKRTRKTSGPYLRGKDRYGESLNIGTVNQNRIFQTRSRKPKMTMMSRSLGNWGMPVRVMNKHTYYGYGDIKTAVTSGGITSVFRLRNMFDPEVTFVGHQPRGRDQMVSAGYTYYSVHAAKVTLKMVTGLTEDMFPNGMFVAYLTGASDPFQDQTEIMELGTNSNGIVLGKVLVGSTQSSASSTNTAGSILYVEKFIPNLYRLATRFDYAGGSNPQTSEYFDYNQYTAVGNNPDSNTDVYLTLKSCGSVPATGSQGFEYWIQIQFYCEWYRPDPNAS